MTADLFLINQLHERMRNDVVNFAYRKNDGTVRHAFGTLNGEIIDEQLSRKPQKPASGRKRSGGYPDSVFPYFDLEKLDWRCFRKDALLDVDDDFGF